MNVIKNKLLDLIRHMDMNRQTGHTTAVIHGVKTIDANIIVHSRSMTDLIERGGPKSPLYSGPVKLKKRKAGVPIKCITINELDRLNGDHNPIVFDNCAIRMLFAQSIDEINRLEFKVSRLEQKMEKIKRITLES